MKSADIQTGMKLRGKSGEFEVVRVLPFGRLSLGKRTGKPNSTGFDPIVREWELPKRQIVEGIEKGEIEVVSMDEFDWYERRAELRVDMVFRDFEGDLVKLDRRVPGDGTKWYVAVMWNGSWAYMDDTIEPGDLQGEPLPDPELNSAVTA